MLPKQKEINNTVELSTNQGYPIDKVNQIIPVDGIMYGETFEKLTYLYISDGKIISTNEGLKRLINKLPIHKFIRVSYTHFINIDYVHKLLLENTLEVILYNGKIIKVSAGLKKTIEAILKK